GERTISVSCSHVRRLPDDDESEQPQGQLVTFALPSRYSLWPPCTSIGESLRVHAAQWWGGRVSTAHRHRWTWFATPHSRQRPEGWSEEKGGKEDGRRVSKN